MARSVTCRRDESAISAGIVARGHVAEKRANCVFPVALRAQDPSKGTEKGEDRGREGACPWKEAGF